MIHPKSAFPIWYRGLILINESMNPPCLAWAIFASISVLRRACSAIKFFCERSFSANRSNSSWRSASDLSWSLWFNSFISCSCYFMNSTRPLSPVAVTASQSLAMEISLFTTAADYTGTILPSHWCKSLCVVFGSALPPFAPKKKTWSSRMFWKMSCLHTFFIYANQLFHMITFPSAGFLDLSTILFMSSLSQKVNTTPTCSALRPLTASNRVSKSYFCALVGRTLA